MRNKILPLLAALLLVLSGCQKQSGIPTSTSIPTLPPTPSLPLVASPEILRFTMSDSINGWALSETAVLRTFDGGLTWYDATPAGLISAGYSASVDFKDANTARLVSSISDSTSGTLYSTMDGGQNWTSTIVEFSGGYFSFPDETNGWVLQPLGAAMSHEAVAIFRSDDSGITWTQTYANEPDNPSANDSLPFVGNKTGITAIDGSHAWVTGSQPSSDFIYFYATQDGGLSWTHQELAFPDEFSGAMTSTSPPHFFNATTGVLPVGFYTDSISMVFYTTDNAGSTWSSTAPVGLGGQFSIATQVDFYVWDGGQTLFASHDAGQTWSQVTPNVDLKDDLSGFQFVDDHHGWSLTVDNQGHHQLYTTGDGGMTWTILVP